MLPFYFAFFRVISLHNFTILFNFHRPPVPLGPSVPLFAPSAVVLLRFSSFLHQFFATRFVMIPFVRLLLHRLRAAYECRANEKERMSGVFIVRT